MPNAVPKIAECGIFLEVLPHISLLRRRLPGIFNASLSKLKKYAEWRSEICRMTNLPSLPWLAPSLPKTKDNRSFSIRFATPFECFTIQNAPRKLMSVGFDAICYSPKLDTAVEVVRKGSRNRKPEYRGGFCFFGQRIKRHVRPIRDYRETSYWASSAQDLALRGNCLVSWHFVYLVAN